MIPLVDVAAEHSACGNEMHNAVQSVLHGGQYILGPQVSSLETKLCDFVQPKDNARPVHCISVSDGTTALQLSLMCLQIGAAHEVITVPFTWISTAEVISLVGARPVFVDVDVNTYTLDIECLKDAITASTRAVIVVSLYGLVPDLRAIRNVLDGAESKFWTRIALIEDGAQSFGSIRNSHRSCGSPYATLSTTSFFPTKPLACYGDGGAVFTQDPKLAATLRSLRVHGRNPDTLLYERIGLNARLDTLQAAVLLTKFAMFEQNARRRSEIAHRYNCLFSEDPRIIVPVYQNVRENDASFFHVYGVYTVRVAQRDAVANAMRDAGVACAIYYPICLHLQPVFKPAPTENLPSLPVAERLAKQVLALPMHPYLTEKVQDVVVKTLKKSLDKCGVTEAPE